MVLGLVGLASGLPAEASAQAGAPFPDTQRSHGLSIAFEPMPSIRAGENATLDFWITDAVTGQPIRGLRPESAAKLNNGEGNLDFCGKDMKRRTSRYGSHTPVQFNAYIVALNSLDGSLSVLDPGVRSKLLLKKVPLGGQGYDIALAWLGQHIFVTVEPNVVVVVDGVSMTVIQRITVGKDPHHLAIQPDGKYVWVGNDGDVSVSVIDADTHRIAATIPVGRGHHAFAFTEDSRLVAVTNQEDHSVTLVSVRDLAPVRTVSVGRNPHGVGYSPLSRSFYVANEGAGTLTVIDAERALVSETISVGAGVRTIRFRSDGRWGYALNRVENTVMIIDATINTVVQTYSTGIAPDDIVFQYDWAFIRNTGSADVTIISLKHPGLQQNFPVGHAPPKHVETPQAHSSLVGLGDGHQVLVPNPADGAVYQMMAGGVVGPIRVYSTGGQGPAHAVVYWHGFREVSPGRYRRALTFDEPGRYEIGFYIASPQLSTCFELTVQSSPPVPEPARAPRAGGRQAGKQ